MGKKTLTIFSLVVSFLSLIYMVLNYYGFIRKWELSLYSVDSYLKAYSKKEKYWTEKVIVSLNVTEKEHDLLKPCLNSILDQSVRADDIVLNFLGKKLIDLPALKKFKKYKYDSADNALSNTLKHERDDCIIILVNKLKIYGKDFVLDLLLENNERKTSVIYADEKNVILAKPSFFGENFVKENNVYAWIEKNQLKT